MQEPAIAVLPYGKSLGPKQANLPLDALSWPLGRPARLGSGVLRDLGPQDHLIVYPRTVMHFQPSFGTAAKISLVMGEPAVIHAKHFLMLRVSWRRFFRVLAFNEDVLARIPNGVFFPYGTTWVPGWRDLDLTKSRHMSLIASAKRDTEGHKLRHRIAERARTAGLGIDILGRGYEPFDVKSDGLAPYRFSIVIENMRERNYFSEKLLDAVFCDTIPIYWGCPNLNSFVNTDGIIQCDSEAALWAAVEAADAGTFEARLPHLSAIKPELERYSDLERRAAETIRSIL